MYNFISKLFNWVFPFLLKLEFSKTIASYIALFVNMLILFFIAYLTYFVFRLLLVTILAGVAKRTKTKFDDLLIDNKTAKYISYLIPFLLIYNCVPIIMSGFVYWENIFGKIVGIYIVFLTLWVTRSVLKAFRDYLKLNPKYSDKPIDSYVQVIMIVLWIFGITIIISEIFDVTSNTLFGTLGAISAVIILIFRDTILGFVASVQVSLNDMIRIGDWVTFDKFGADGDVIEINLATVKIRNFDHTTTTIPTYSLISDSFRNWRGMLDSDGRRIKRHLLVKAKSIRFLKQEELEELKKIQLIKSYIEIRQSEIDKYNDENNVDKSIPINGRNITNFGLFRKYVIQYLESQPSLNKNLTLMCRQLQATPQGIPLEIYAFTNDKKLENYEYIMADIFDHLIAAVEYFDLELYEGEMIKS